MVAGRRQPLGLARSLPDARVIADELTSRQVKLALGTSVHDPTDAVGRLLFNVLAMVAQFEADLIRARRRHRPRGRSRERLTPPRTLSTSPGS